MTRKEALFAVIGGVVGAVLVMAAGSFAPLGAQNEVADAEFGTITCRELVVGDSTAAVLIFGDERGEHVSVAGKDGSPEAIMTGGEHGGRFAVFGKDASTNGGDACGRRWRACGGAR